MKNKYIKTLFLFLFFLSIPALGFNPTTSLYYYSADLVRIYDGDTLWVDLDLGLGVWKRNEAIRLYGIDTPEVRGEERTEGLLSRDHLKKLLSNKKMIVETVKDKDGKYGRLLAIVWIEGSGEWCPKDTWCNVNDQLVKDKQAVYKTY